MSEAAEGSATRTRGIPALMTWHNTMAAVALLVSSSSLRGAVDGAHASTMSMPNGPSVHALVLCGWHVSRNLLLGESHQSDPFRTSVRKR